MEDRRLALPWFRSGDYDEIRRIMSDGHKMANSYEVWLKDAEAESKRAESHGMLVERVMIEPYEFEVWCAANGQGRVRSRAICRRECGLRFEKPSLIRLIVGASGRLRSLRVPNA